MDQSRLNRAFAALEAAAVEGARCPQAHELPKGSGGTVPALARDGRIKIEISGQNWRQVTILVGPNKGKKTAPNPLGHGAWKVIDARSPVRNHLGNDAERERKRVWAPPQGG